MSFQRPATPVYCRRIMGIETEYGVISTPVPGKRALSPDELGRELFRPVVAKYQSSNIFTPNASRLYLDVGSHPEIATAECDSLSQLLRYERAGDVIINDLAQQAEQALHAQGLAKQVYVFKNNVDSAGNSYGCHENYLVSRHIVLKEFGRQLLPFFITRQLLAGAGTILPAHGNTPACFAYSQRADHVWEAVSSATTRSRPIINTRDEPHGDSSRFRRMHVIVGDSTMAEPTFALKVGSTQLMLEMLEAGFPLPDLSVNDPITAIRAISRDLSGRTSLDLAAGGTITALDIQEQLCEAARSWLKQRPDEGTPNDELARVVDLWERVVVSIGTQNFSAIDTEIDWAIKLKLVQRYRDSAGLTWDDPKLAQVDLTYHDIRPGRGLYDILNRRGLITRWDASADFAGAVDTPPRTTRAHLRGRFLATARELGANVTVDWTRMKVNRPEPRVVECADPFAATDAGVEGLIEYMQETCAQP